MTIVASEDRRISGCGESHAKVNGMWRTTASAAQTNEAPLPYWALLHFMAFSFVLCNTYSKPASGPEMRDAFGKWYHTSKQSKLASSNLYELTVSVFVRLVFTHTKNVCM
jgi:hypothetical protein